jgi:hypothetical protein
LAVRLKTLWVYGGTDALPRLAVAVIEPGQDQTSVVGRLRQIPNVRSEAQISGISIAASGKTLEI